MARLLYQLSFEEGDFCTFDEAPNRGEVSVQQVHETTILPVSKVNKETQADGLELLFSEELSQDHPMAIRTADCLPLLFLGEKGVHLIHAGHRGLAKGILKNPAIQRIFPHTLFIGPSIHPCCYEVQEDFYKSFPKGPLYNEHTKSDQRQKLTFNLQGFCQAQCEELFPYVKVINSQICTFCHEVFHSFRRNGTKERNWNLFYPKRILGH